MWAFWKNGGNPFTIDVNKISRPWNSETADWLHYDAEALWDSPGGDYAEKIISMNAPAGYNINVWDEYDILAAVEDFINDPEHNYGLLFQSVSGGDGHGYRTSEVGDISKRPKLTIVYEGGTSTEPAMCRGHKSLPNTAIVAMTQRNLLTYSINGNSTGMLRLGLYSCTGELVEERMVEGSSGTVLLPGLSMGAYVFVMKSNNTLFTSGKVFIR